MPVSRQRRVQKTNTVRPLSTPVYAAICTQIYVCVLFVGVCASLSRDQGRDRVEKRKCNRKKRKKPAIFRLLSISEGVSAISPSDTASSPSKTYSNDYRQEQRTNKQTTRITDSRYKLKHTTNPPLNHPTNQPSAAAGHPQTMKKLQVPRNGSFP